MKKEYIAATAILLKKQLGETISDEENEIATSLRENDSEFRVLADKIINENYLSFIEEYAETNAEARLASNIKKRIDEIKRTRIAKRRRNLTMIGAAAAMIAVIITLSLQFVGTEPTLSPLNNSITYVETNLQDVILMTNKGENTKLTGTTYYAKEKKTDTVEMTVSSANTIATIIVPMTKDFNIILSDGTKVWLNSGSKLTFPDKFTDDERVVTIDGEGYFEVSHDANRPFIVRDLIMDTKVLGTKFLVSAYSTDESRSVSLVEGSIEVSSSISDFKSKLTPGRGVVFDTKKHNFRNVEINIENTLAKMNGMLVFENESLKTICSALMRKYGITYTIANEKLGERQFYIRTKKYDSIEAVMELLKIAGDINYKIEENKLTIY